MNGHAESCLLRMAAGGEDAGEALGQLYTELFHPVYLLAASLINDRHAAEDIAQEVFLTARQVAGRYRPGSSGRAWLFSITRNLCLHHLRDSRRLADGQTAPAEGHDHESHALETIVAADALRRLSKREYDVVTLHVFGGFSLVEIAGATGTPYGTVLWRYHSARGKLKRYYSSA